MTLSRFIRTLKRNLNPPGWTIIALSLLIRNTKLGNVILSQEITDYLDYCQVRNKVSRSVRFAKRKFERGISLVAKVNPKSFWKFVKSKSKTRSGIGDLKNNSREWISDDHEKANELNTFFSSVFTKNENNYMPEFKSDVSSSVCDITVTKRKVESMLKLLNVSKSTRPDEFHQRFLMKLQNSLPYQ